MPLPLVSCDDLAVPEGCCNSIWDQGVALITATAASLSECLVAHDCCGRGLRAYVSLGPPEIWLSDILVVWLEPPGMFLSPKSVSGSGKMIAVPQLSILWRVYLIESGYPALTESGDGTIRTPTDDELHLANTHAYAHGEALLRGLLGSDLMHCGGLTLRDMNFVGPTAGPNEEVHAGWSIGVAVDLRL